MLGALDPEDWSHYWKGSTITTFQGLFEDNYAREILEFWQRNIPGDREHVLDIACGNGALSWIANDILNKEENRTRITGIDFANIDPFRRLNRNKKNYPKVSFIANTPIETMPFENQSIDLIMSQYGAEYSDLDKSVPEMSRVLKNGGKLCLIMHIENSVLIKTEREMLRVCSSVLNEDRLHDKYLELDQLYRSTADDTHPDIGKLKIEIHHLTYHIQRKIGVFRHKADLDNYIYRMEKVFAENIPRRSRKREQTILLAKNELSTYTNRLADLIGAARTPRDIEHLVDLLARHGLSVVEKEPVYIGGQELCGLSLVAVKH